MSKKPPKPNDRPSALPKMTIASKNLLKELPSKEEFSTNLYKAKSVSDSATALLGVVYLERALESLICATFRPLSSEDHNTMFGSATGILSTFGAKIRMAYASKIISQSVYDDLLIISAIRNAFAHSAHIVTFKSPEIIKDCKQLNAVDKADKHHGITTTIGIAPGPIDFYINTIINFTFNFQMKAEYIRSNVEFIAIPGCDFFGD